jgi:hypothetical protein
VAAEPGGFRAGGTDEHGLANSWLTLDQDGSALACGNLAHAASEQRYLVVATDQQAVH